MYQALLTRRYFSSKIMPYLAIAAVGLCACMVLVVWSVMGGFLTMLLDLGRKMEGDVSITWPTVGFAYYEDLIDRLEKDPMVAAAAPVIESFGMINLPDDRVKGVTLRGVDARYAKVSDYAEAIWWKPIEKPLPKDRDESDPRLKPDWPLIMESSLQNARRVEQLAGLDQDSFLPPRPGLFRSWAQLQEDGLDLLVTDARTGERRPGVVLGIELSTFSKRQPEGFYSPGELVGTRKSDGSMQWQTGFITARQVTVTVLPMDRRGRSVAPRPRVLPVANEFRTGFFEADKNHVLMNLGELQRMLNMEGGVRVDTSDVDPYAIETENGQERTQQPRVLKEDPPRVTTILVKAKPGIGSDELRARAEEIYAEFAGVHGAEVPSAQAMTRSRGVSTWERSQATFIGAVKKETALVLFLLMGISLVAVFLILAIFWSMVSEKTKDIGILRAVGGTRFGVAWLWLRYGLAIGVVGAAAGGLLAYTIITNINPIHEWMGQALGLVIWDPNVYYFSEIPNKVEPDKAAIVLACALIFSVAGALIPALRAAYMDPVRALRFE